MRMADLIQAQDAFKKLAAQDLSLKTLYKIFKLLDEVEAQLKFYESQRMKLLGKYCRYENGTYTPIPEFEEEFNDKVRELMNLELGIDEEDLPVRISEAEDAKLSYSDLYALKKFIEIGGADEE